MQSRVIIIMHPATVFLLQISGNLMATVSRPLTGSCAHNGIQYALFRGTCSADVSLACTLAASRLKRVFETVISSHVELGKYLHLSD